MSTKEQYWKYSLITIILVMGVVIFFKATPFLGGLLGAATIYILLRNQMLYLIEKKHMKKSLMATPHVNRDYSDFSDSDISGRLAFNQ